MKTKFYSILTVLLAFSLQINSALAHDREEKCDCSLTSNFHKVYFASANSCADARILARGYCSEAEGEMFCREEPNCKKQKSHHGCKTYACSIQSNFNNTYFGRGSSKIEATARARQECASKESGMFCQGRASCEEE